MDSLASNDEQVIVGAADDQVALPGDLAVANRREFFHEADEVKEALRRVAQPDLEARACREACERVGAIWGQYQEQPGLLDPFLEDMVSPLMDAIAGAVRSKPRAAQAAFPNLHMLSSLLYLLTSVRGYKTVARFFPHEACDLEPCLEAAEVEAAGGQADTWSTLYCLTLWLGMVLLTPFDLRSIDSGGVKGLSARIQDLGKRGLWSPSRNRDASAWMLAKHFMRPDVTAEGALRAFLGWTRELWKPLGEGQGLGAEKSSGQSQAQPPSLAALTLVRTGSLQAWNQTLKTAQRAVLQPVWSELLSLMLAGPAGAGPGDFAASSSLRKLRVTVACRAGLVALPPRLASWRYERGARSLLFNFAQATGVTAITNCAHANTGGASSSSGGRAAQSEQTAAGAVDTAKDQAEEEEEEEEEEEVPEQVDEVVELLLDSLSDADTVVRWAAAKGVGRLTNRLSQDFGDQVLESLLDRCFSIRATDKAWHGGCLALAELARRGLLLPGRLETVVPLVCQALHFEQVTGTHAVGQHVRDAACYVCWAFARAYAPDVLTAYVAELASVLLQVAVFDREINCRRAAAAAVQEHVGRQGTFPKGIEVVTIADYWSVSSRRNAYLDVAPQLACLGTYRHALIDCLVDRKLQHQDLQVRSLACEAVARLAQGASEEVVVYFNGTVLPKLLVRAMEPPQVAGPTAAAAPVGTAAASVVQLRHGAVAGIAAIVPVLQDRISTENQTPIRNLVPSLEKARAYRGRGGEVIRRAACDLLGNLAAARSWPFKEATCTRYLQTLDECSRHTTESIQVAAVGALKALVVHRLKPELCGKCLANYVAGLRKADETIAARRGLVLSLGVFPADLLGEHFQEVLSVLCREAQGAELPGGKEHEDPQTRQFAVLSLGRLCLGRQLNTEELNLLLGALNAAMRDYAVDRRGDVGSWVREVAVEVIAALLSCQRCGQHPALQDACDASRLVALLLQQAVEKIDRLRERAFWLLRWALTGVCGTDVEWAYRRVCHGEQYDLGDLKIKQDESQPQPGPAWPPAHIDVLSQALGKVASTASTQVGLEGGLGGGQSPLGQEERSAALFAAVAPTLAYDEYRGSVLQGLVVSVGGLTESTTKDAKAALLQFLRGGGEQGVETTHVRQSQVCEGLMEIFTRIGIRDANPETKRMLTALLNTCGILLAEDCVPVAWADALLEKTLNAVRSSLDIGRLRASVPVLVGLLRWPGSVRRSAFSVLAQLLGYSFPVVRQSTAHALYVRLLEEEGDLDLSAGPQDASETSHTGSAQDSAAFTPPARAGVGIVSASALAEVLELLSVTPWGTDNEEVLVQALHTVYSKLGLELPTSGRSILVPGKEKPGKNKRMPEYADLVHENHY